MIKSPLLAKEVRKVKWVTWNNIRIAQRIVTIVIHSYNTTDQWIGQDISSQRLITPKSSPNLPATFGSSSRWFLKEFISKMKGFELNLIKYILFIFNLIFAVSKWKLLEVIFVSFHFIMNIEIRQIFLDFWNRFNNSGITGTLRCWRI